MYTICDLLIFIFSVENMAFSELVIKCQELIREFALDQLKELGIEEEEAILRSTSSVSQRDIQVCVNLQRQYSIVFLVAQRVFTFYNWILKTYETLQT